MNEHQTPGSGGHAGYKGNVSSPGGNSPVTGRGSDRDRFGRMGAGQDFRQYATDRPYNEASGRDWGARHTSEGHYTRTLPILAMGIGGGLMLGWLLPGLGGAKHRGNGGRQGSWHEAGYGSERSDRGHGSSRTGGSMYESSRVATDETRDLIASDKVEGTAVYDRNGERLGSVYNFMVGKRSGRVAYAVMSFGGWLGMGESYHPLPWHTLTYDTDRGGYVVSLSKERLRNAPSHKADQDRASDAGYWRQVKDYWA
jgi:hypothetical protein